jgi:hypothetical protein
MNILVETLQQRVTDCHVEIPYGFENGNLIIGKVLTPPGVEIARKKQEMPVPYEEIESEEASRNQIMRNLVKTMNDLPFLATVACCQGHSKDEADGDKLDNNTRYVWGGWLSFVFDPRLPQCVQFFDGFELLIRQSSFIKVNFHDVEKTGGYSVEPSNDRYGLPFCGMVFDLHEGEVMPRVKAEHTVELYDQFWSKLQTLIKSFKVYE